MNAPLHNASENELVSETDFTKIARLVYDMTGIDLQPNKKAMVASRLAKRLRATGTHSVQDYIDHLQSDSGAEERDRFVSAYTTNMTRFNREGHHFQHLAKDVLPHLASRARKGARIRLWSAGCSSGEEPYQLAIHLLEACPEAASLDVKLLATDIDQEILDAARTGIYPRAHVKALPEDGFERYFDTLGAAGDRMKVQQKVRDLIVFQRLNLHDDWPFKGKFDVIMCRNVAIYFNDQMQAQLWRRFSQRLMPGGFVYLGHSENLGPDCASLYTPVGNAIYRLKAQASESAPPAQPDHLGRTG